MIQYRHVFLGLHVGDGNHHRLVMVRSLTSGSGSLRERRENVGMVGCKGPFLILGGGDGTGDVIGPAGRLLIGLVAATTYKPVEHHGGVRIAHLSLLEVQYLGRIF